MEVRSVRAPIHSDSIQIFRPLGGVLAHNVKPLRFINNIPFSISLCCTSAINPEHSNNTALFNLLGISFCDHRQWPDECIFLFFAAASNSSFIPCSWSTEVCSLFPAAVPIPNITRRESLFTLQQSRARRLSGRLNVTRDLESKMY